MPSPELSPERAPSSPYDSKHQKGGKHPDLPPPPCKPDDTKCHETRRMAMARKLASVLPGDKITVLGAEEAEALMG